MLRNIETWYEANIVSKSRKLAWGLQVSHDVRGAFWLGHGGKKRSKQFIDVCRIQTEGIIGAFN